MSFHSFLVVCAVSLVIAVLTPSVSCSEDNGNIRLKRQSYSSAGSQDVGNNFIDSIFQIPISTLTAVGTLIKNTRPVVMRARERIQQQYEQYQQQQQQQQQGSSRPSRGSSYNRNRNKRRRNGIQGRDYPNY